MSSITSTQSGLGLSQFLQSLTGSTSTSAANTSAGAITSTSTSTSTQSAPTSHHHHRGGAFGKLADAVTNALQKVSGSSEDPNQTITDVLTKIFQNGSLGGSDSDGQPATPASNNANPAAPTVNTSGTPDEFTQTLKSFGVTPQQFQTDLQNALKNAQANGATDVASVFKSFPIGSVVDSIG